MSQRERRLLVVLGVVAVAALVYFLLTRGGGEQAAPVPTAAPTLSPSPSPSPSPGRRIPPLSIFGGRDPFVPLVVAPSAGGGTSAPTTSPTGGGGGPTPSVSPAGSPTSGGSTVGGHQVVVLDVFRQNGTEFVQVEVDGSVFTVTEGETFDDNFKVVSINDPCATFLFGDERFTACQEGVGK